MSATTQHATNLRMSAAEARARYNHPAFRAQRLRDHSAATQRHTATHGAATSMQRNTAADAPLRLTRRGKAAIAVAVFLTALGVGYATAGYSINYSTTTPTIYSNR